MSHGVLSTSAHCPCHVPRVARPCHASTVTPLFPPLILTYSVLRNPSYTVVTLLLGCILASRASSYGNYKAQLHNFNNRYSQQFTICGMLSSNLFMLFSFCQGIHSWKGLCKTSVTLYRINNQKWHVSPFTWWLSAGAVIGPPLHVSGNKTSVNLGFFVNQNYQGSTCHWSLRF